jgi:uncharacterized membrane protein
MSKIGWMRYIPCHRKADRSFVSDIQSLFCCRCTGMHLGFFLGFVYLAFTSNFFVSSISVANLILLVPLLIDGLTQRAGWRTSDNAIRFATGLLFGFGMVPFFGISEIGPAQNFEMYLAFIVFASIVLILLQKYILGENLIRLFSSISIVIYPTGLLLSALLLHRFTLYLFP